MASVSDIPEIVSIHRAAFRNTFLTHLGAAFLRYYYALVLDYSGGIVLVPNGRGELTGFVAGFVQPEEFYRRMRRHTLHLIAPTVSAMVRNPTLIGRVIYNFRRIQQVSRAKSSPAAELASIAVRPVASGQGIGKLLVKAFLAEAWSKGAHSVYLTTDADHNEPANHFYGTLGFRLHRRFEQYKGRRMNEYVIRRQTSIEV